MLISADTELEAFQEFTLTTLKSKNNTFLLLFMKVQQTNGPKGQ